VYRLGAAIPRASRIGYDLVMGSLSRSENLGRLRDGATWDVAVIGGGATGLGTAVDAAARGLRTLLLEASDFAHGTSSRSTKLIHGGVRYLAQGNIGLVREALRERGVLLRNAPHLVHRRDFVVPAYRWLDLPYYGIGLKVYDGLAGSLRLGASRWIGPAEVAARIPTIRSQRLHGGIVYTDGQFDDARLAIALARTLADLGGTALNYMAVTGFTKRAGKIAGLEARDAETGEDIRIEARAFVNATGVYVDALRRLDDARSQPLVTPSQGAHLVLDRSFLPGGTALLVPRTDDGRVLFLIPWHNHVLVGTTDTPVTELPIEPRPLHEEVVYLLAHLERYLERSPGKGEIKSIYAGLRPLLRGRIGSRTARLSREHAVAVSQSGLVTITGGKWTTYRRMAVDAVDHAIRAGGLPVRPSSTSELKLHGYREPADDDESFLAVYGSDAPDLAALCQQHPEWNQPLHPSLPYRSGEVIWAARHEAARSVSDVLARRTRALFLDARASIEAAPRVAALVAHELGRPAAWQEDQAAEFRTLATRYLPDT
jgi:glycerol-3-phosphate dehydrogenase